MHDLSVAEHEHRLAYAERQFEHWRLRVVQAQLEAQRELAIGRLDHAEKRIDAANNWLRHLEDCNGTIDEHRRALAALRVGEGNHG